MPIYTYGDNQSHTKEVAHSIQDEPEIICPECGERMRRVPRATTIKFNGKGFAINDK